MKSGYRQSKMVCLREIVTATAETGDSAGIGDKAAGQDLKMHQRAGSEEKRTKWFCTSSSDLASSSLGSDVVQVVKHGI
ncbi:MAG: hypothetical protein E3J50_04225 [Dehalococcoidia bacterium]|nr:MAG: hypothetical protein E3J50_04225 [Dehalococcoidia bacterium]